MTNSAISEMPEQWEKGFEALAQIHAQAFSVQGDRPWAARELRDIVESAGCQTYFEYADDLITGFILTRAVCDEAELITIAVTPDSQKRGTGGRLLDHVTRVLSDQGVKRLFLEVREDNVAAIKLYRSRGFEDVGRRAAYYQTQGGNRVDALCFALILGD